MNLLRYNVAMSLDGFIAGPDGEYDWIPADPGVDFVALFSEFDAFIMGRKTFDMVQALGDQDPTKGRSILVVSHTLPQPDIPEVEVMREVLPERIRAWKAAARKDLWLFGGAPLPAPAGSGAGGPGGGVGDPHPAGRRHPAGARWRRPGPAAPQPSGPAQRNPAAGLCGAGRLDPVLRPETPPCLEPPRNHCKPRPHRWIP